MIKILNNNNIKDNMERIKKELKSMFEYFVINIETFEFLKMIENDLDSYDKQILKIAKFIKLILSILSEIDEIKRTKRRKK